MSPKRMHESDSAMEPSSKEQSMSPKRKHESDSAMEPSSKEQQDALQAEGMQLRTRGSSRHFPSMTVSAGPTSTSTDSGCESVPTSSAELEGRKRRKTTNAKAATAATSVRGKRLPGRQRVPKKNPRIEAYYIRMHELKNAFRDVARALVPALHELESRTETDLKSKPGYLESSQEHKNITKALETHLNNRKALERAVLDHKSKLVKRESESARQVVKDTYSRRTQAITDQLAAHIKLDVMKIVANHDDEDDTSSDETISFECDNTRHSNLYLPSPHGWKKETGALNAVQPLLPEDSVRYEPSVRYYETNMPLYRLIDESWDDWITRSKMDAVLNDVSPTRPAPLLVLPRKKTPTESQNMEMLLAAACTVEEKEFIKSQGGLMALAQAAEAGELDLGGEELRKKEWEAKNGTLEEYVATLPMPTLPLPKMKWNRHSKSRIR